MVYNRDHRTAEEKWNQLMADARSTGRRQLFEHRRSLPECRETWPRSSTQRKRNPFPEDSSASLLGGKTPYGFRDDTEDEVTIKVTTLGPLSAVSRNHGDDDKTETHIAKVVKVFRKKNSGQTVQNPPCSIMDSCAEEIPIETQAGPSWIEWCAWDEEYLWSRFDTLNLPYRRLVPFGQSCSFMDLGYENVRRNMTERLGMALYNPAFRVLIVQQRFWNLAVHRPRKSLPLDWRMLERQQLYEHENGGFPSFSCFTDSTTVVPSEAWVNCLIRYTSLRGAQDAHHCDFLAKGVCDMAGQLHFLQERNHWAKKIHALWLESMHLENCAMRRPSDSPLAGSERSTRAQEVLPWQDQQTFGHQEATYVHERWQQSPHLMSGVKDIESRARTPDLAEGWVVAGHHVNNRQNPFGSIGSGARRQKLRVDTHIIKE